MNMKKYMDLLWAIHNCGNLMDRTFFIEVDAPKQEVQSLAGNREVYDIGRMSIVAGIRRPGDILPILRGIAVRGIRARVYAGYHEGGDAFVMGVNR